VTLFTNYNEYFHKVSPPVTVSMLLLLIVV